MGRRVSLRAKPAPLPTGRHIDPTAAYGQREAMRLLKVDENFLRREVREGRLKERAVSNRKEYLGAWLLAWYELGTGKEGTT